MDKIDGNTTKMSVFNNESKLGGVMKTKLLMTFLIFTLIFAAGLYGQESLFSGNTMTIFKGDVDKLADVNDYSEVKIKKVYLVTGARFDEAINAVRGFKGGFATYLDKLYFGMFYDGYFWDGDENTTKIGSNQQDRADRGFFFDNNFNVIVGNENIGGIAFNLGFANLGIDEDVNDPVTVTTRSGMINFGGLWGKNFGVGNGTLKPELGFNVGINMDKIERKTGATTVENGHGPSFLSFNLTAEYLFAREGQHQTTFSFGDLPLFAFKYENKGPPKEEFGGGVYNTLFGEIKQVYDLSGSLSVGYLVGLSLAINAPTDQKDVDDFEFGFLPRVSFGLAYKASEKFTFNTGVRLGSLRPDLVSGDFGNMNDNFGIFYQSTKYTNYKSSTWYFLPFVGSWGLGLFWQPEEIFSADFSVDSKINTAPGVGGFNFNVLFTLQL